MKISVQNLILWYWIYNYTDCLHGSIYIHENNRYARCHLRPCRACLLIKGSGWTLWLIAGDQDGFKKSWKSVHCFIITFLTIYFLGKIIWQLFAKMGHPTEHCLTLEFCAKNPNKKKESCHVKFLERHFSCAEYTWPLIGCYKSCTYEVTWVLTNQKPEFPRAHYAIYHDEINV